MEYFFIQQVFKKRSHISPDAGPCAGGVAGVVRHPLKQHREFERYLIDVHFLAYFTVNRNMSNIYINLLVLDLLNINRKTISGLCYMSILLRLLHVNRNMSNIYINLLVLDLLNINRKTSISGLCYMSILLHTLDVNGKTSNRY